MSQRNSNLQEAQADLEDRWNLYVLSVLSHLSHQILPYLHVALVVPVINEHGDCNWMLSLHWILCMHIDNYNAQLMFGVKNRY